MQRLVLLLLLATVVETGVYGQINYFFDLQVNYPVIPNYEESSPYNFMIPSSAGYFVTYPEYKVIESYQPKPGFDVLFGLSKNVTNRVSLESGIGISFIRFQRKETIDNLASDDFRTPIVIITTGQPFGSIYGSNQNEELLPGEIKYLNPDDLNSNDAVIGANENDGKTRIAYLTVPLKIRYMIANNRLAANLGMSASILTYSRQSSSQVSLELYPYTNEVLPRWTADNITAPYKINVIERIDKSGEGLKKVICSGNFDLQYRFLKTTWINAGYEHSFIPIYNEDESIRGRAKNRLLRLGLRHYLRG